MSSQRSAPRGNLLARAALSLLAGSAALAACSAGGAAEQSREAALNGVWQLAKPAAKQLRGVDGAPPLNEAGAKIYAERQAMLARGDTSYDLAGARCKPMGLPRVLWDGGPFDIQLQKNLVFFGYTFNRNHRNLPIVDKLPPLQIPRYYGTSAARWEGDTLVIDSGLFVDATLLDSAGLPHSDNMRLLERYKPLAGGRQLEASVTITDPDYYLKPWTVSMRYQRVPDGRIREDVCEERSSFYRPLLGLK